jgi:hypothetical protein
MRPWHLQGLLLACAKGKTASTSCALRLLQQGCGAFIGATGLAFGSHIQPDLLMENADLLAMSFFQSVSGPSVGDALVRARQAFQAALPTAATNAFCQKTLLQFMLLGDPASI